MDIAGVRVEHSVLTVVVDTFLDDTLSSLYFVQSPPSTTFPFLPRNPKVFDDSTIDLTYFPLSTTRLQHHAFDLP